MSVLPWQPQVCSLYLWVWDSLQLSSVPQSCLTLCKPRDYTTPDFTNSRSLFKLMSLTPCCHPTISSSVVSFSSCLQSYPASGSFPMNQFFASGGQSIGASAPVHPMTIQDWVGISRGKLLHIGWAKTSSYRLAQGSIFNILWQNIMEKNMKKSIRFHILFHYLLS